MTNYKKRNIPTKIRKEVLERDKKCIKCGSLKKLEVHHIHLEMCGGSEELDNLVTLCKECHTDFHKRFNYDEQLHNKDKEEHIKLFNEFLELPTSEEMYLMCMSYIRTGGNEEITFKHMMDLTKSVRRVLYTLDDYIEKHSNY